MMSDDEDDWKSMLMNDDKDDDQKDFARSTLGEVGGSDAPM